MAIANLDGISVLVVEDEGLQAIQLQTALENAGASVIGPVGQVDDAWDLIDLPQLDCAILDVNLHGEMIFPVADALLEHDVPVIFVTAYADEQLPQRYLGLPLLRKPLSLEPLTRTIERELSDGEID
jgi:DNA-binding response OmpR family regulator